VKWEIPTEPENVLEVWGPDETGDGWIHWVKAPMRTTGSLRYWRRFEDHDKTGPEIWYSWLEVLDRGPVSDENPNPGPPGMCWSPSRQTLYVWIPHANSWVVAWKSRLSAGVAAAPPDDAIPVEGP
jgi:hypothetical protein